MDKSACICAVVASFVLGMIVEGHFNNLDNRPVYAINPKGCEILGMVASGWENHSTYLGGAATSLTLTECRKKN